MSIKQSAKPNSSSKINSQEKADIFDSITNSIIEVIEAGKACGSITWAGQGKAAGLPFNLKTGAHYNGINVLLLWAAAASAGYTANAWLTFKQAQEMGGHVRKGEKGTSCVFWGSKEIEDEEKDEDATKKIVFAKGFTLFNIEQIDGIEFASEAVASNEWQAIERAEAVIKATGARIFEGGNRAFYAAVKDEIHMPDRNRFVSAQNFYAVQLHELSHWTGHKTRLGRDLQNRFGSEAYAMEELVAELGAAFLSADLGIAGRIEGHASYIESWLKVLKSDKRAIVTAASAASKAAQFILSAGNQVADKAAA